MNQYVYRLCQGTFNPPKNKVRIFNMMKKLKGVSQGTFNPPKNKVRTFIMLKKVKGVKFVYCNKLLKININKLKLYELFK